MEHSHEKSTPQRAQWASNFGFILAAAGSAIGLGNIWKFPGRAYHGGGALYMITYIFIVVFIGAAAMIAELTLGRHTQKNPVGAFRQMGKQRWTWVGGLGVFTAFVIVSYYAQVGGWVMQYIVAYLTDSASIYADPAAYFYRVLGSEGMPIQAAFIYPAIFLGLATFALVRGVEKGIEKLNRVLMPGLFILLFLLLARSITLPGASEGIRYLLQPDFSKFNTEMLMSALGQAFYSLSLGMGIMCTYGSYVSKDQNLLKSTAIICSLDTLVAFLSAFIIIPAVFAMGVEPGMGGGFAFVSLAGVFEKIPYGFLVGAMFYLLLFFAALTSTVSLIEVVVSYVIEDHPQISRKKSTCILSVILLFLGSLYTLSQLYLPLKGIWLDGRNGLTYPGLGDFMELLTDRLLIPFNALIFCIFVAWIWGANKAAGEVEEHGVTFHLKNTWMLLIKYFVPVAIGCILVAGLGFGMALS